MKLTFHVIYTSGTVRLLRLFACSLLDHSSYSFRLVSNGLPAEERQVLQRFCARSPRLVYAELPWSEMVSHGKALDYLQGQERGEYFCFMDSDIYALSSLDDELEPLLGKQAAIFSAAALWESREDQLHRSNYHILAGRHTHAANGECLGSTFFAVYPNQALGEIIRQYGMGFERRAWKEIPPPVQEHLASIRMKKINYDTGKVLVLLLRAAGHNLRWMDSRALRHIGGVSLNAHKQQFQPLGGQSRSLRSRPVRFFVRWLQHRLRHLLGRRDPIDVVIGWREFRSLTAMVQKKALVSFFFNKLLRSLAGETQTPAPLRLGDAAMQANLAAAAREIASLYQQYGGSLDE